MSKTAALMLILVFITAPCTVAATPVWASTDTAEDSWVSRAPMQVARGNLGVAVVNGKIYAIGGSVDAVRALGYGYIGQVGTNEEYDQETDTWVFKAQMPTARSCFAIATYQGKIYCIGGHLENNSVTDVNEVYDPETDTWETKTAMPTARRLLQAHVVGDKIYLIGGTSGGNAALKCEVYDPASDSWTTPASIPPKTAWYASAVVDGKIYIIRASRTYIYAAEVDTWSQGADAPSYTVEGAAGATTGVLAPKRIYVMAITDQIIAGEPPPCITQVYNPASDSWINGISMPTARGNFGVAVINDKIYAIGGHTSDCLFNYPTAVNEQYTPIGYGTPDPTPSPSPSSSPSPSPSSSNQQPELIYTAAATAAAITLIIITATAVALKKRHKLKTTP